MTTSTVPYLKPLCLVCYPCWYYSKVPLFSYMSPLSVLLFWSNSELFLLMDVRSLSASYISLFFVEWDWNSHICAVSENASGNFSWNLIGILYFSKCKLPFNITFWIMTLWIVDFFYSRLLISVYHTLQKQILGWRESTFSVPLLSFHVVFKVLLQVFKFLECFYSGHSLNYCK